MRTLIGACALFWGLALVAAPATAAQPPLTLAEAIASVLEHNPRLRSADFDNRAAAARIRQQSQQVPWSVGVETENLGNQGLSRLQSTLSVGRVLELGDKPRLRGAVAEAQAQRLLDEQAVERLDLLTEAAGYFLDIAHAQEWRSLAEERVALKQRTLRVVNRRFGLGKAPNAELGRARIELARAELAREEIDHLVNTARRRLAALWGEATPAFSAVQTDLYLLQPLPDEATLEGWLERNPSLTRFATQRRLADARLRLAGASRRPDLELRGGVRHVNESDDVGLLLSLNLPLGSARRAEPLLAEARALGEREPLLEEERRLALRTTLFVLVRELSHAREVVEALRGRIIPDAREVLDDTQRGYAAGRYSLLELIQAEESLLGARREALGAAVDYQRARAEIDRLTASTLTGGLQ